MSYIRCSREQFGRIISPHGFHLLVANFIFEGNQISTGVGLPVHCGYNGVSVDGVGVLVGG